MGRWWINGGGRAYDVDCVEAVVGRSAEQSRTPRLLANRTGRIVSRKCKVKKTRTYEAVPLDLTGYPTVPPYGGGPHSDKNSA